MANIERHLQMNPDDSWALGTGAVNLASLGERDRAIEWTERAIEASGEESIIIYNSACTFAVLGEHDRALDLPDRSVALGRGAGAWFQNANHHASIHDNPLFRERKTSVRGK